MTMNKENAQMAQVVKMKQGMSYSCKEKTIILNVFKYFKNIYPEKCVTEIVRRTSKATGCSEKSVFQFRKEEASVEGFKQPSKTKIRKNININSRFIKYDNNVRQAIRNIIYDLKYRNIVPSLSTILKNVNSDEKLPNFSLMTLRRLLFDMGFCYEKEKIGSKPVLVEKPPVKKEIYNKNQNNSQSVNHNVINARNTTMHETKPIVQPHSTGNVLQNPIFLPNQGHRVMPPPVAQPDNHNHMMDSLHIPHSMMMNHRMPHQIQHVPHSMHLKPPDINFMHHSLPHPHNMVMQQ